MHSLITFNELKNLDQFINVTNFIFAWKLFFDLRRDMNKLLSSNFSTTFIKILLNDTLSKLRSVFRLKTSCSIEVAKNLYTLVEVKEEFTQVTLLRVN